MDIRYIGTRLDVLDHGHVTLVDHMGGDADVVSAARVSYGQGTKKRSEDRQLIRYMMRNRHTSVFEQVVFKFHVKAPIFVFRQWHRHRTQSINEQSARYSEMTCEFYRPNEDRICGQSLVNKQGDNNQKVAQAKLIDSELNTEQQKAKDAYQSYLDRDVAREIARINLPVSTYSEMYTTQNLHNLLHFLKLRMDSHAQWEIRQYANAIYELIKPIVPISCEAFEDYVLNAKTFSMEELSMIRQFLKESHFDINEYDHELSKREVNEFKEKLGMRC